MSKYAIFAGDTFYPQGGYLDLYDCCDTLEQANEIYNEALSVGSKHISSWNEPDGFGLDENNKRKFYKCNWAHIVNLQTKLIIKST